MSTQTLNMIDKAEHAMCGGHIHTEVVSKAIVREWLHSIRATVESAPDLLAALNTIAYEPIGHSEASLREVYDGILEISRAAVAKAKGQS